jgi:hypothetical protein
MKKVVFCYTSDVTTPRHLAGTTGQEIKLNLPDAEILRDQGYGYLKQEGPPKPPPARDAFDAALELEKTLEPEKTPEKPIHGPEPDTQAVTKTKKPPQKGVMHVRHKGKSAATPEQGPA